MGGETETQGQPRAKATTTPVTSKEPIAAVPVEGDKLIIRLFKPSREPFSKYPLPPRSAKITCRMNFRDQGVRETAKVVFPGSADPTELVETITRKEAESLKSVDLWAEPYGYAALLYKSNGELALGKLSIRITAPAASNTPHKITVDVEVLKSVVAFIADEMNTNKNHPDIKALKPDVEELERLKKELERLKSEESFGNVFKIVDLARPIARLEGKIENKMAEMFHTNSGVKGALYDVWFLGGGHWDQKPVIGPVWGQKNRLGDSEKVYYYDIWSNMHYGYIGHAAGLSSSWLHSGADRQQKVDSYIPDEDADWSSVEAGYRLYSPGMNVTLEDVLSVVERHPEWLIERREEAWKKKK